MSRRAIFLDIGAHWGETLEEVLSQLWRFDLVIAFEPDPEAVRIISEKFAAAIAAGKLIVEPVALSDRDGEAVLFGGNEGGGASLYAEKAGVDPARRVAIPLAAAGAYFARRFSKDDIIVAKLNCEGGEIDILNDLVASGEIHKLAAAVIDFDIRKVKGKRALARDTMNRMRAAGFDRFALTESVMIGPDARHRTRNALASMPAAAALCADPAALPNPPRRPKWSRRIKAFFRYL